MLTPEMEAEYLKGSASKKNGIIVGLTRQFAMTQQQKEEDRLAKAQKANEEIARQHLAISKLAEDRQRAEMLWTPPQEAIDAAKDTDTPYLPIGPGKYALRSPHNPDAQDTVDYPDPQTGVVHKVPIRSALGQKILEKSNPAMALEWNYGISPDELKNSKLHEAGTVDSTGAFKPTDNETGTHIRIGGSTVMPKQAFEFYKNRLAKTGQAGTDVVRQTDSGGPVKVKTIAEAQALPKGTPFIDPNGVARIR